jgi:ribosome-associated translation inhibitor RaiA
MEHPVDIVLRGIPRSGALERYIGERARRLNIVCDRLQSCHVVAEALHRPKQQGAQFSVRLNITLPGTEVVVNREHREDVHVAVDDAFEAAELQLKDHMRRDSGMQPGPRTGTRHPHR